MKKLDVSGQRFGYLTAVRWHSYKSGNSAWLCRCDCGAEKVILLSNLKSTTKSCGCWRRKFLVTHGLSQSRIYNVWSLMVNRCTTNEPRMKRYYGKISVCRRWRKFENFFADMGHPPDGMTLDRINNAKGYSPSNCRWATWEQQNNNTRFNRRLTHQGKTMTVAQWARHLGMSVEVIRKRLCYGWNTKRALNTGGVLCATAKKTDVPD